MRRSTRFLAALLLTGALAVAGLGTVAVSSAGAVTPDPTATVFCRSAAGLLRFMAHAPDPRQLASPRGRRVLRALRTGVPTELDAATVRIVDSFRYLSRHGSGSLTKRRDAATGDALLELALYGASHCTQARFGTVAQGLAARRLAQAEARAKSTTTTTRG